MLSLKSSGLKAYYSVIAPQLKTPSGVFGRYITSRILDHINKKINDAIISEGDYGSEESLLDLGCGTGLLFASLLSAGHRGTLYGVDLSKEMLAICRQRYKSQLDSNQLVLKQGCFTDIPMKDHSCDHVISANTIYFWNDPDAVVAEIRRVLKPGGSICIALRSAEKMAQHPLEEFGFIAWTPAEVSQLLSQCGFQRLKHVELDKDQFLDMQLIYFLKPKGRD